MVAIILFSGCSKGSTLTPDEQQLVGSYKIDTEELARSAGVSKEMMENNLSSRFDLYERKGKKVFHWEVAGGIIRGEWSVFKNELRLKQEHVYLPLNDQRGSLKKEKSDKTIIFIVDASKTKLQPIAHVEKGVRKEVSEGGQVPYKKRED